jgi:hypothetical protein
MKVARLTILVLWSLLGIFSYLFLVTNTNGLAYPDPSSPTGIGYTLGQSNSGNFGVNDDLCIGFGFLFTFTFIVYTALRLILIKLLHMKQTRGSVSMIIHVILLIILTLHIKSIQKGSIITTIVVEKNLILLFWIGSYVSLWLVFWVVFWVFFWRLFKEEKYQT